MSFNDLAELREEIRRGRKFLRACEYDATTKRLVPTLGSHVCEGGTKAFILQPSAEPSGLAEWIGHELFGVRFYHDLQRTTAHVDLGPTITFDVHNEAEPESQREELDT